MSHKAIYATVTGVFAALLVVMLVTFDYDKQNDAADQKAEQLITLYEAFDLPVPAKAEQISRTLGDDGGAVCATAKSASDLNQLKTQLGVGGEFYVRATDIDDSTIAGLVLIVGVYCPDQLDHVLDFVDDLDLHPDLSDVDFDLSKIRDAIAQVTGND